MISCNVTGAKWEDLLWRIEMFLPDVPEEILAQSIRAAAIKFIGDSRAVRRWIEFEPQSNVGDYPIDLEDCWVPLRVSKLVLVHRVCHELQPPIEDPLCPCDVPEPEPCCCCEEEEPTTTEYVEANEVSDCKNRFWLKEGWINLAPPPGPEITKIKMYLSMRPSMKSCEIPIEISEEYGEVIADFARAKFLNMKGEDWYDPNQATLIKREFSGAAANAAIEAGGKACHEELCSN